MWITVFSLLVLLFSVVLHEVAHGFVAYQLGDPTAKYEGRLTLNPLKHLDLFGSLILPLATLVLTFGRGPIFGFAKPVPVNPYNLRDQKWGELKVAIAGPTVNFLIGTGFGLLIRFFSMPYIALVAVSIISLYNFFWGVFNLMPVPPLDGSHILLSLLPRKFDNIKLIFKQYGFAILIIFLFFGLRFVEPLAHRMFQVVTGYPFTI